MCRTFRHASERQENKGEDGASGSRQDADERDRGGGGRRVAVHKGKYLTTVRDEACRRYKTAIQTVAVHNGGYGRRNGALPMSITSNCTEAGGGQSQSELPAATSPGHSADARRPAGAATSAGACLLAVDFITARCYAASAVLAMALCLSVRLSVRH